MKTDKEIYGIGAHYLKWALVMCIVALIGMQIGTTIKEAGSVSLETTTDEPAAPPVSRMTVAGSIALDFDQIDAVEVLAFPRAGMTEDHNVVRVWYEDGRSFDILEDSQEAAYARMIYFALNAGI